MEISVKNKKIIEIIDEVLNKINQPGLLFNLNFKIQNLVYSRDGEYLIIEMKKRKSVFVRFYLYDGDLRIDIEDLEELFDFSFEEINKEREKVKKIIWMIFVSMVLYQKISNSCIKMHFIFNNIIETYTYQKTLFNFIIGCKTEEKLYMPMFEIIPTLKYF